MYIKKICLNSLLVFCLLTGCSDKKNINNNNIQNSYDINYSENVNLFDSPIYFDIEEKQKIKQWAYENDGSFSYFVNDIESWGNDLQRSIRNFDMSLTNIVIEKTKKVTTLAIIDTSFNKDYFSISDSIWRNKNEIESDNIDNDKNGYIDDVYGYNFTANNNMVFDKKGLHGTFILGLLCAKPNISGYKNIIGDNNIKIMCLKSLDDNTGEAKISDVILVKYIFISGLLIYLGFRNVSWSLCGWKRDNSAINTNMANEFVSITRVCRLRWAD